MSKLVKVTLTTSKKKNDADSGIDEDVYDEEDENSQRSGCAGDLGDSHGIFDEYDEDEDEGADMYGVDAEDGDNTTTAAATGAEGAAEKAVPVDHPAAGLQHYLRTAPKDGTVKGKRDNKYITSLFYQDVKEYHPFASIPISTSLLYRIIALAVRQRRFISGSSKTYSNSSTAWRVGPFLKGILRRVASCTSSWHRSSKTLWRMPPRFTGGLKLCSSTSPTVRTSGPFTSPSIWRI